MGNKGSAYKVLVENPEGNSTLGRPGDIDRKII
jgi:hypothetical protein